VTGWDVQIKLRIPLDDPPELSANRTGQLPKAGAPRGASSNDRLRSLGEHRGPVLPDAGSPGARRGDQEGGGRQWPMNRSTSRPRGVTVL
jgi:hypothetical protein